MKAHWWERKPHWLKQELDGFDAAGMKHHRDEEAAGQGILRLHVEAEVDGEQVRLIVTYPALYPYFRVEVQAPGLKLSHHQNPFEKNLCLLGRRTENWEPTDTAAAVLAEQLPKVLRTARTDDLQAVFGVEQEQAEPISVYYPYVPGMILMQSGWEIDQGHGSGRLLIGTQTPNGSLPPQPVRGAVLEVLANGGQKLAEVGSSVRRAYSGLPLKGRWARVAEPIRQSDEIAFLTELFTKEPNVRDAPTNRVQGGFLNIWAVLFPEETGHRQIGEGWTFICRFDEKVDRLKRRVESMKKVGPMVSR